MDNELAPDTVINNTYRIVRKLGEGGMGSVYLAQNLVSGGEEAIKTISPEFAADPVHMDYFTRGAKALRDVKHRSVVSYHGLFRDQFDRPFLAMEFVAGEALSALVRSGCRFKPSEICIIGARVSGGLHAAHQCGIIHRDMSPDNIILRQAKIEEPIIIDFGIAKLTRSEGGMVSDESSRVVGKERYMAPEQAGFVDAPISAKTDIYGLGVVLAELMLGKRIVGRGELPKGGAPLADLLVSMTALQPDDRPPDMAAIETALIEIAAEADATIVQGAEAPTIVALSSSVMRSTSSISSVSKTGATSSIAPPPQTLQPNIPEERSAIDRPMFSVKHLLIGASAFIFLIVGLVAVGVYFALRNAGDKKQTTQIADAPSSVDALNPAGADPDALRDIAQPIDDSATDKSDEPALPATQSTSSTASQSPAESGTPSSDANAAQSNAAPNGGNAKGASVPKQQETTSSATDYALPINTQPTTPKTTTPKSETEKPVAKQTPPPTPQKPSAQRFSWNGFFAAPVCFDVELEGNKFIYRIEYQLAVGTLRNGVQNRELSDAKLVQAAGCGSEDNFCRLTIDKKSYLNFRFDSEDAGVRLDYAMNGTKPGNTIVAQPSCL